MTVQHDLSLDPQARMNRRVANLEQGFISNQQEGAWIKNVVGAESGNATETPQYINGVFYSLPTYGQYLVNFSGDGELRVGGFAVFQIAINGTHVGTQAIISPAQRAPVALSWGGWIERTGTVGVKMWIVAPASGGAAWVFSNNMVVTKIA